MSTIEYMIKYWEKELNNPNKTEWRKGLVKSKLKSLKKQVK